MKVSQKRKDDIQAKIEELLNVLRLFVRIRDLEREAQLDDNPKFWDVPISNGVKMVKALRRKSWGFTNKQILRLMALEHHRKPKK